MKNTIIFSVRISVQFLEYRCHIRTARGTKNFARPVFSSGNRHKFTSMFICASLALPCASVARYRAKFQVPLTALKMHPYFGEPPRYIPIIKIYHFSQLQKHSLNRFRYKNTLPRNNCFGIECFILKMVEIYFSNFLFYFPIRKRKFFASCKYYCCTSGYYCNNAPQYDWCGISGLCFCCCSIVCCRCCGGWCCSWCCNCS